jgi:hypothetical protein
MVALALIFGGATFYAVESGMLKPHPQQAESLTRAACKEEI